MLSPSSRLREYEVWGRIGGGGMSDVYLARHVDLCAPVVVKTLKLSVGSNADERVQRLRTEAIITSRIRSPRVVRLILTPFHYKQVLERGGTAARNGGPTSAPTSASGLTICYSLF